MRRFWILIIIFTVLFLTLQILILLDASIEAELKTSGLATLSIFFAFLTAVATWSQADELRQQREELERPRVLIFFEAASDGAVYCVIRNVGYSAAKSLHTFFDPSPVNIDDIPLNQLTVFAKPISFLPAGSELRQIIDVSFSFLKKPQNIVFRTEIIYKSIRDKEYKEVTEFDLTYMMDATRPRKTEAEHLEKIAKVLNEISRTIKRPISPLFNTLLVESPKEFEERWEEELRSRKQAKERGSRADQEADSNTDKAETTLLPNGVEDGGDGEGEAGE